MASNNPFDTSVFNEVRPTYVGPPVEELSGAREYLTQTGRENILAKGILDQAFANSINEVQGDDEAVAMIVDHKNKFEQSLGEITNEKNMAYAGPTIQGYVNKFVGDARITGRKGLVAENKGIVEALRNNKNLDPVTQKLYMEYANNYPNRVEVADDELYRYKLKDMPLPYENIDFNKDVLEAIHLKLGFPKITSSNSIRYRKPGSSELTDVYDPSYGVVLVDETNTVVKEVDAQTLQKVIESVIEGDDKIRGNIVQKAVINEYLTGIDGRPVPERFAEVYENPTLTANTVKNAATKFAEAFAYNQRLSDRSLKDLSTSRASGGRGSDDEPFNPLSIYKGGNIPSNPLPDKKTTIEQASNTKQALDNITADAGGTPAQSQQFNQAVANRDYATIAKINSELGEKDENGNVIRPAYSPEQINNMISSSRASQLSYDVAQRKLTNAADKALEAIPTYTKDGKTISLKDISSNPDIKYGLRELGIDFNSYPGGSDVDKVITMLDDIDAKYNEAISKRASIENLSRMGGPITKEAQAIQDKKLKDANELVSKYTTAKEYIDPIRSSYDRLIRMYNREEESILEAKDVASDEILSNQIYSYDFNNNRKTYDELVKYMSIPARLNDMKVFDSSTGIQWEPNAIKPTDKIKVNAISTSPTKAGDTGSASWIVDMTVASADGKNSRDHSVRIPVESDKGGISTKAFDDLIKYDKRYLAGSMVNEALLANIEGEFPITGYENYKINRDNKTKKLSYSTPMGKFSSHKELVEGIATQMKVEDLQAVLGENYNDVIDVLAAMPIPAGTSMEDAASMVYEAIYGIEEDETTPYAKDAIATAIKMIHYGR